VKENNLKKLHYDSNYIKFWKKQNYRDNKRSMLARDFGDGWD